MGNKIPSSNIFSQISNDVISTKPQVLAIDDDQDFLAILTHLISVIDYELIAATDASQGLRLARSSRPEIIFCDLRLPGKLDGFDFVRSIRKDPKLCSIPVIAITGFVDVRVSEGAMDAGFTDVFGKPVKFLQIKNALKRYAPQ